MSRRLAARILCSAKAESPQQDKAQALVAEGYRFDFEHEPTKDKGAYISAIIEIEGPIYAGEAGEALIYIAVPDELIGSFKVGDKGRLLRGHMDYATTEIVSIVNDVTRDKDQD